MTQHDDRISLQQMLDHAVEVSDLASDRTLEDLNDDRLLQLATLRLLEVLGEAATRVSSDAKDRNPEIPWPRIVALRNRLIHAYDRVDCEIVWAIIQNDIPPLIAALGSAIKQEVN